MKSFDKFKTLAAANAGAKLMLKDPAGKETEDWVKVYGIDSDNFRRATNQMRRDTLAYLEANGGPSVATKTDAYADFTHGQRLKVQVALVADWSFKEECSPANIIELLTNAPDVADQIDEFSSKRERFVAIAPVVSEPSPSIKSDSRSPRQATQVAA